MTFKKEYLLKSIATFTVFEKIHFFTPAGMRLTPVTRRKVLSKWTHRMKNTWASDEVAPLFVTGPTDSVANPSHFYCPLCRRDVTVLSHGSFECLRHYQVTKHLQRPRLTSRDAWVEGARFQWKTHARRRSWASASQDHEDYLCGVIESILSVRISFLMMLVLMTLSCPC